MTVTETSVDASFPEGTTPAAQDLHVTAHNVPTGTTVYVDVESDSTAVLSINYDFAGSGAIAILQLDPSLAPGDYQGTVTVRLCSDGACLHPIAGANQQLPLSVHVSHVFRLTTDPYVALQATSGQTTSTHVGIELPDDATAFTVDTGSAAWLSVANQTSSGFDLVAQSVPAGEYGASPKITVAGANLFLNVDYKVSEPPGGQHGLIVGTATLAANAGATATADLSVSPPTWGAAVHVAFAYVTVAGEPTGWLTVTPSADGYQLMADATSLPLGTYHAMLYLTGDSYTAQVDRMLTFTVQNGLPYVADQLLTLDAETPLSALSLSAPTYVNVTPVPWAARSDVPWIVIDTPTGTTGQPVRLHVSPTAQSSLANQQSHVGTVVFTQPGVPGAESQFSVTLVKNLPVVTSVGPGVLTSNAAHRLWVRGVGFGAVADLSRRVTIGGVAGAPVTPVNDTEFIVDVPAHAAGRDAIAVTNAAGATTPGAIVQWLAPATRAYKFLPQDGIKGGIVWEPVRQTIYTVNEDRAALEAFHWNGNGWVQSSASVPSAITVGLSPDRQTLVVGAADGTLRLMSPDTLATISTVTVPKSSIYFNGWYDQGLPITNDGRAWFFDAGFLPHWYDLRTGAFGDPDFTEIRKQAAWQYASGLNVMLSRNGERLLLSPTSGGGSYTTAQYLDAKDEVLHVNPGGAHVFIRGTVDEAGDRWIDDWSSQVFDESFNLIGTIPPTGDAYAMSPAGDRAYVMYGATINVYDSSQMPSGGVQLPLLGSFSIPDTVGCDWTTEGCPPMANTAVAPDGQTIFMAGHYGIAIVPIPPAFQGHATLAQARRAAASTLRGLAHRSAPAPLAAPSAPVRAQ
jgi:hypothetical protein